MAETTMPAIHVRPATVDDAAAIAEVHVASWRAAYRTLMPEAVLSALSVTERQASWSASIAQGEQTHLVAECDGEVVGFVAFGPSRDDDASADTLEILVLYVSPHFWSRGAGRALCQACHSSAHALGAKRLTLWTLIENDRARRFYVSIGFHEQPDATRPYERNGVALKQVRHVQTIFAQPIQPDTLPFQMNITICLTDTVTTEEVVPLYQANQWSSADKPAQLISALQNSHSLVTARIDGRLVGLGNAISDGYLVVYYPHMLVHPEHQGKGIGRLMMSALAKKYAGFHQQMLTADGDAIGFYERMGFVHAGRTVPMWIYAGTEH